jgi:RimJ/RimL family protein N-acetyltransferase
MTPLITGLRSERVTLAPPDRRLHLENAFRWLNDPEVAGTLKYNLGVTYRQEEIFFDRVEAGSPDQFFWAIHDESGRHIGFIDLKGINWRQRCAGGGLLIGERSAWSQGYATEAVRLRTRFGFEELGLHRIEGHTINPAMRRVYEKCGYKYEGTLRQKVWHAGRWHDAAFYAILDTDALETK